MVSPASRYGQCLRLYGARDSGGRGIFVTGSCHTLIFDYIPPLLAVLVSIFHFSLIFFSSYCHLLHFCMATICPGAFLCKTLFHFSLILCFLFYLSDTWHLPSNYLQQCHCHPCTCSSASVRLSTWPSISHFISILSSSVVAHLVSLLRILSHMDAEFSITLICRIFFLIIDIDTVFIFAITNSNRNNKIGIFPKIYEMGKQVR